MMETAEKTLSNPDLYPYFGVGSPTPMPFEYDIEKINTVEGNILKAYALLGLGRGREALRALDEARHGNRTTSEFMPSKRSKTGYKSTKR